MVKVLHILNGLGSGGAEAFGINTVKALNKEGYIFDFLIRSNTGNIYMEEVKQLGCQVFLSPDFPKKALLNKKFVKNFFSEKISEYDYIHIHANSLIYTYPLYFSKKYTNSKIIIHSHNTKANGLVSQGLHLINKKRKLITENEIKLACSYEAGKWMFDKDFQVVFNSIDTNKFKFNIDSRKKLREMYSISEEYKIIGNVGRLHNQKNQLFLLDIFKEYLKINNKAKLFLVGNGDLKKRLLEKAERLGIVDGLILTGGVTNIAEYYSFFDVLVMPSIYEGLPLSLIEAQASGLKCLVSREAISNEAAVTNLVTFKELKNSASEWAEDINNISSKYNRENFDKIVSNKGFGQKSLAENMKKIYL